MRTRFTFGPSVYFFQLWVSVPILLNAPFYPFFLSFVSTSLLFILGKLHLHTQTQLIRVWNDKMEIDLQNNNGDKTMTNDEQNRQVQQSQNFITFKDLEQVSFD